MRSALIAIAAFAGSAAAFAQAPVDFSKTPLRHSPLQLPARAVEDGVPSEPAMGIYKPPGAGPFAAIVVVHACGGIRDHIGEWAKSLVAAGYVAFVVDSVTQRNVGYGENCKLPARVHTVEGALDAYGALEHLAAQPYVDRERIGLVGFSWGAMVGLLVARKDVAAFLPRATRELRFRAIASLYPQCSLPSVKTPTGPRPVVWLGQETDRPLLVLMGELDEETPARFCIPRLETLKLIGAPVEWHVYPGTTHSWDSRRSDGHRKETFSGGTHMYRYSAEVTQASRERVLQFFAKELPAKWSGWPIFLHPTRCAYFALRDQLTGSTVQSLAPSPARDASS